MFDNLISPDDQQSPVDALLKLLDTDDINIKTSLEMPHIKFIMTSRMLYLIKTKPDIHILEIQEELMQLYKELMPSYRGKSREQTVEGIKEMKPQLMDINSREVMQK